MTQYIDKAAVVAEIERRRDESWLGMYTKEKGIIFDITDDILSFINTLEVKEENSIWHNIDDTPNYNLNGISDFIIDSCYGHIYGEAHSYTPEQWSAHIGFNANRQFRWAYEKDLINFE